MACEGKVPSNEYLLEHNHSHFLFVDCQDDGNELARFQTDFLNHCIASQESKYRRLNYVAYKHFTVRNLGICAITLLIGGNLMSLRHACYALQKGMPVMVCEMPAAGAAQVLLAGVQRYKRRRINE